MNLPHAFLLAAILAQAPMPTIPAGVQLEPCFHFEVETFFRSKGKLNTEREVLFTPAELPWTDLGIAPRTNLEVGFDASETIVEFDFAGKKVQGKKLTWKRNLRDPANVSAAAIHSWVVPKLRSPSFKVELDKHLAFRLPAGCVKMEVVPHNKNAEGVAAFERESSAPATGRYKQTMIYKLGDKSLEAHEMVFTLVARKGKRSTTYTVSKDMPGEICAMAIDGPVSGTLRVTAITPAPLPNGLAFFPKEGFAFAAPAGYTTAAKPRKGEVVRYVKGDDFMAVSILELGKGGLIELKDALRQPDNKYDLEYVGSSRGRHLAGHRSFDAKHTKTKTPVIVTQHGGRAYLLSASALDRLTASDTRDFLKGWRWLVAVESKGSKR